MINCHTSLFLVNASLLETLIVWTEPDGTDYALSFQDIEGCADVWEYILDVQRAINNERERGTSSSPTNANSHSIFRPDENEEPLSSSSPPSGRPITFTSIVHASQLPPPQFGIMLEVERAINHVGRNANLRDRLCEHIITTVCKFSSGLTPLSLHAGLHPPYG